MCDTESCDRGCGSQLAPTASRGAWDGAGGVLGSWEWDSASSTGRKRAGAAGASPWRGQPMAQGDLPRTCLPLCQGCHHSHCLGSRQPSAAGNPQSPSSSLCAHTLGNHHGAQHRAGGCTRDTPKYHQPCPRLPELPLFAKRTLHTSTRCNSFSFY